MSEEQRYSDELLHHAAQCRWNEGESVRATTLATIKAADGYRRQRGMWPFVRETNFKVEHGGDYVMWQSDHGGFEIHGTNVRHAPQPPAVKIDKARMLQLAQDVRAYIGRRADEAIVALCAAIESLPDSIPAPTVAEPPKVLGYTVMCKGVAVRFDTLPEAEKFARDQYISEVIPFDDFLKRVRAAQRPQTTEPTP